MKVKGLTFFSIATTLLVGIFLGIYIYPSFFPDKTLQIKVAREKGFTYTSPLLYYDIPQERTEFVKRLKSTLTSYIENASKNGMAQDVSIYLRYFNLPDWTVINGSKKYSPASLLKVPVMMVYLKSAETDPSILSTSFVFNTPDDNQKEDFKITNTMTPGQSYTVNDLITRMIIFSDNDAEDMLVSYITEQDFNRVFDALHIKRLDYTHQEDSMDVQTFSYFYRVLYNATFLSPEVSEQALKLLSQTTFTKGIVAGVPKNTTVAHKFGERYFLDTGIAELHDCGIVYFPQNPYLLCIMTRGSSFNNLGTVLKNISQITYNATKQENEKNVARN